MNCHRCGAEGDHGDTWILCVAAARDRGEDQAAEWCFDAVRPGLSVSGKYSSMNPLQAAWQAQEDAALKIKRRFKL
jgi:hypothetical protein